MKTPTSIILSSILGLLTAKVSATSKIQYIDQQKLHDINQAVSAANIEKDIKKLVSFGTRHTLSETESDTRGIGAARRWIKAEFEAISKACGGCLEVYYQSEIISGEKRIPNPTEVVSVCLLYTSPSPRDRQKSRMPSSA